MTALGCSSEIGLGVPGNAGSAAMGRPPDGMQSAMAQAAPSQCARVIGAWMRSMPTAHWYKVGVSAVVMEAILTRFTSNGASIFYAKDDPAALTAGSASLSGSRSSSSVSLSRSSGLTR